MVRGDGCPPATVASLEEKCADASAFDYMECIVELPQACGGNAEASVTFYGAIDTARAIRSLATDARNESSARATDEMNGSFGVYLSSGSHSRYPGYTFRRCKTTGGKRSARVGGGCETESAWTSEDTNPDVDLTATSSDISSGEVIFKNSICSNVLQAY